MTRLLLVRHGPTSASERSAFPRDEPLSGQGHAAAGALRDTLAGALDRPRVISSPALRCRQTAAAAGLRPEIEPAIAEADFGSWAGRTLAEIHAIDPDGAALWMTDSSARPHGGESLHDVCVRVGAWLDAQASRESIVAVTHAGVIKAAVVHALGAPLDAFWRITVAPLSITELMLRCETWELVHLNLPGPAACDRDRAPVADQSEL